MDCPFPPKSPELMKRLRVILAREWVMRRGSQESVEVFDKQLADGTLQWTDDILGYVEPVIEACKIGEVCPGWGLDLDTKDCAIDLLTFACFSRWYALMSPEAQKDVRDELAAGNSAPWTAPGMPPAPTPCDPETQVGQLWCCPRRLWEDPFYAGTIVDNNGSGSGIGLLLGIGIAGAIIYGITRWRKR